MPQLTIQINKDSVWTEVIKTSGYTGDKMIAKEGENPYERIAITNEDRKSWQRFWEEAVAEANDALRAMLVSASAVSEDYDVTLEVSVSYDTVHNNSVVSSLTSFFINAMVARWFRFTDKGEAKDYFDIADLAMTEALRKLYSRKRPTPPARRQG
jgi:flavin-binding protein dodecin